MANKILVVDDNDTNLKILKILLEKEGYEVFIERDAKKVRASVLTHQPNLILLDINMPDINGFELCDRLLTDTMLPKFSIIFISALSDETIIVRGFEKGAVDFITKPFKAEIVKARVATHLKLYDLQAKLEEQNQKLIKTVEVQSKKINEMQMETIFSLAKLAQSRDDDTGRHLERVQKYCFTLSKELAQNSEYKTFIDKNFIKNIVYASPLHDIGKVSIPDAILLKPGKLTPEEFDQIKKHTTFGATTLEEVHKKFGSNTFIEMGIEIAKYHHERWDGKGYPEGLSGIKIPLSARIMAIADVYDALSAKRVYKDAFPHKKCVEIILEGRGTQFDPIITDAFVNVADEFELIKQTCAEKLTKIE